MAKKKIPEFVQNEPLYHVISVAFESWTEFERIEVQMKSTLESLKRSEILAGRINTRKVDALQLKQVIGDMLTNLTNTFSDLLTRSTAATQAFTAIWEQFENYIVATIATPAPLVEERQQVVEESSPATKARKQFENQVYENVQPTLQEPLREESYLENYDFYEDESEDYYPEETDFYHKRNI